MFGTITPATAAQSAVNVTPHPTKIPHESRTSQNA
jgi:hypothetical protein